MSKPKILFYDIETSPLQAWVWSCGKQVVRHGQLVEGRDEYDVICLAYEWLHSKDGGILDWGYEEQNSEKLVKDFTEICGEADMIIGVNNKRFDDKHMNTLRLKHNLDGHPEVMSKVDDLQAQLRKHFYLPSYSLDYVSKKAGLGGKTSMCFQDWIDIVEKTSNGEKAFNKMLKYCRKDVADTKKIWKWCEKHIQPKFNYSAVSPDLCCKVCGSRKIRKNGIYTAVTGVKYQQYFCTNHNGYAGKISVNARKQMLRG